MHHMYIYIYIYREREGDIDIHIYTYYVVAMGGPRARASAGLRGDAQGPGRRPWRPSEGT